MQKPLSAISQIRWMECVNGDATEIPAFGLVRVSAVDAFGVLTVNKPNATGQEVLVNGPSPIPANGKGVVTGDLPVPVAYTGAIAVGDTFGAASGTYLATKNCPGFTVLGSTTIGGTAKMMGHSRALTHAAYRSTETSSVTSAHDISFGNPYFNVGNVGDSTITINNAGTYFLTGRATVTQTPGTGDDRIFLSLKQNSAYVASSDTLIRGGLTISAQVSALVQFSAADTLKLTVKGPGNLAVEVDAGGGSSSYSAYLFIVQIL